MANIADALAQVNTVLTDLQSDLTDLQTAVSDLSDATSSDPNDAVVVAVVAALEAAGYTITAPVPELPAEDTPTE